MSDDWPECAADGCNLKTYDGGRYCFPHSRDSDTHPKDGDSTEIEAPLGSGAGLKGIAHTSSGGGK